jgi:N4-gp56 family major capsid protein
MANAYTGTAAFANLVQPAYDRLVEFSLRAQPLHREVADKKPAQQAMPGSSVTFELYQDLATATSTLTETVDPDAVALGNPTTVSVTLAEYGNAVLRTRLLNLFSFSDVDPAIANIVAFNMVDSLDAVVLNVLVAGTNVIREASASMTFNTGSAANVTSTDVIKSRDIFAATAKLRANKALPRKGALYWAAIHPEVAYDLKQESGSGGVGWLAPHAYSAPGSIWASEIGSYGGAFFVETPRSYNATDGAASTRVFRTLVAGQQALAEAVAEEPHVVVGPVVDKLMRARPIGWYGVLGWSLYRQPALYRIETTSSIHNT